MIEQFKLKNIQIKNYKKYDSLSLLFGGEFMLIIGENGSGKTTVLDAIATMLGGYLQAFKDIPASERHSINKADIKIDIHDRDENISVEYKTPVSVDGTLDINTEEVNISRFRRSLTSTKTELLKTQNETLYTLVRNLENTEEKIFPILSYHGTGSIVVDFVNTNLYKI